MTSLSLPDHVLAQCSNLIAARMGWHFPSDRWHDLERGIRAAAQDLGFTDVQTCIDWLHSAPLTQQQIAILADHFTIGETYFFREQRGLEALTTQILPPLMHDRQLGDRHLRIWSAACCTGEEPYSIAITLATTIPQLSDWRVSIIGTDINPRFLQRAASGVYTEWSFRNTPDWIKTRYFQRTPDSRFVICPEIRQMVTFFPLNLADAIFPAPLNAAATVDVIFCRNVFIYFSSERAQTVIRNFHHTLADGGWLIVSPSETPYLTHSPFTAVSLPGIIIHRKDEPPYRSTFGGKPFAGPAQEGRTIRSHPQRIPAPKSPSELVFFEWPKKNEQSRATLVETTQTLERASPYVSNPSSANYAEAKTLYGQGRYVEASEKLRAILTPQDHTSTPFHQEETLLLIRACANQGALDDAIAWCHKAITTDVLNPRFYYLLATVLLEQGREEEAAQALRQTLYLDSEFVLAHFTLGNLSLRQKKPKSARRHFQNALTLLRRYEQAVIIPESEGLTAGRLSELIRTMLPQSLLRST